MFIITVTNYLKKKKFPQEKHGLSFLTDLKQIGLIALGSTTSNWICMQK